MRNCDVIVVGAGMAGSSLAFEAASSADIVVLEREEQPGYHATGRSAAAYIPSYGHDNPAFHCLTLASREVFDNPPSAFSEARLLRQRGLLTLGDPAKAELFLSNARALQQVIPDLRLVDAAEIYAKAPLLKQDSATVGHFEPDVFDIDVNELHQGYLRGLRQCGGELHCDTEITGITYKDSKWRVNTNKNEYRAPLLVNAAGAWADEVATAAGVPTVGLQPLRRTVILLAPPTPLDPTDWPLVMASNGCYFKPDAQQILFSPADEHPSLPCDARPEELDIAVAADLAQQVLELPALKIQHSWAGLRTFANDRTPVIGFDPGHSGFFWLAGQGGHGIQTAPAAARLAASLLFKAPLPEALAGLKFDTQWVAPNRNRS